MSMSCAAIMRTLGFDRLEVALPKSGDKVVRIKEATFKKGESVLVNGPSGAGKSTLFRAVSGIWPFGAGKITLPESDKVMLLPQKPYVPIGTLRAALTYPAAPDAYPDAVVRAVLDAVRLSQFAGRLDEEGHWGQTMSLGEQQRLALGRALPRQARLALPRRGDLGARRAARAGDVSSPPGAASGRHDHIDRASPYAERLPPAADRASVGGRRRVGGVRVPPASLAAE